MRPGQINPEGVKMFFTTILPSLLFMGLLYEIVGAKLDAINRSRRHALRQGRPVGKRKAKGRSRKGRTPRS